MTLAGRRYVKGLRYNLPPSSPLASIVAADTAPTPTAMYIEPPDSSAQYRQALAALIDDSPMAQWVWHTSNGAMPPLPATSL